MGIHNAIYADEGDSKDSIRLFVAYSREQGVYLRQWSRRDLLDQLQQVFILCYDIIDFSRQLVVG